MTTDKKPATEKHVFAFGRTNFIVLTIGMAIVIRDMMPMYGKGSTETHFDPNIFSAMRIKVAPAVCFWAILPLFLASFIGPKAMKKR